MIHLRKYLIKEISNQQLLDFILGYFKEVRLDKNQLLAKVGESLPYLFFVEEGCLQTFINNSDNEIVTRDLLTFGDWYSVLNPVNKVYSSPENIRAIEKTTICTLHHSDLEKIFIDYPESKALYTKLMSIVMLVNADRLNNFVSISAKERIRWLKENKNYLYTHLSNRVLASYIGITEETFSRLKNKV